MQRRRSEAFDLDGRASVRSPGRKLAVDTGRPLHSPRMMRRRWFVLAAAALLALPALAQDKGDNRPHKKITLDDLVIEGNIQKPEAFFILPRTNLNFADLERREDLKSRIIKSVEKEPF
jgi:hypothetical protein